jgi:hypothetical protein
VDKWGNVYISDTDHNQIDMWSVTNNTLANVVATTYGWNPGYIAVDSNGITYTCNYDANLACDVIVEWNGLDELVNFLRPTFVALALDGVGNVYYPNLAAGEIMEYIATNGSISLVVSNLSSPIGVALDVAGNIYIVDGSLKEWNVANETLTSLGPNGAESVAVDGSGNVYFNEASSILKWSPVNSNTTLVLNAGLNFPTDVAVDGAGNLYIADTENNAIKELPFAFVDPSPRLESAAAGKDALPVVLPATQNLRPPFAPTSDQSWLTITGITNGVVYFSFTVYSGANRTAHISLLGQTIPIMQGVVPPSLSTGPRGATLATGNNGTLTVTASGSGPLSYQWLVNGTNLAGATNSALNLGALQLSNAGLYSVIVSNAAGSVTSGVAVLNVVPELSAQLTNRNVVLTWPGPYLLQAAGQLSGAFADISSAASQYLESTTTNAQRYYRLRSMPFRLSGTNLPNAGFSLSSAGVPGCNFVVEVSTNLASWQPLQTNPSPFTMTDTNAANYPFRFYRAALAH